ncbi:MAG: MBL fold metallo-hydrolase [Bacteroidota bacterium]
MPIRIELPTFFGMKAVNCFLFKEPVPTLIDCGEGTEPVWEAIQVGLKENGLVVEDLERVVITHAHVDHMGSAARIAESAAAKIWVSDLVYDWAIDLEKMWMQREKLIVGTIQRFIGKEKYDQLLPAFSSMAEMIKKAWPKIPESALHIFDHEGEIEMGGAAWQTLYMPGHSVNQSVFFNEKNGHLLSADMLLKITPTPVIDASVENPLEREKGIFRLMDSYARLKELPIQKVFPGHYACFTDAQEKIETQTNRILERKEICYELIKNGATHFMEIAKAMYPHNLHLPAVNMVVGYLDLLEAEERIFYGKENGKGVPILTK